jgi:hypothetical protein
MILCFLILLFILILISNYENFSYFNLNLNLNNPISYNNQPSYENIKSDISSDMRDISFNDLNSDIFNNRINFKKIANIDYKDKIITTDLLDSNKCCLVQKNFIDGKFSYKYTPLKNEKCNINLYEIDNNNKLLFDNINEWNNGNCNNNTKILGSCRRANNECIDFVTKLECNNITLETKGDFFLKFNFENKNNLLTTKTIWSNKTCQDY